MALPSVERDARERECERCGKRFRSKAGAPGRFCQWSCFRADAEAGRKGPPEKVVTMPCAQCSSEVTRRLAVNRSGQYADKLFCNRACYNAHRTAVIERRVAERPRCKHCNEPMKERTVVQRVYCGMTCRNEAIRPAARHCVACSTWFTPLYWKADGTYTVRGSTKTCSTECHHRLYREDETRKAKISAAFQGKLHPNWKGGPATGAQSGYRGPGWARLRKQIRERDGHACRDCGKAESEAGRAHEVHHVTPFNQFGGDNAKANRPSNLRTLCKSCHTKADWEWARTHDVQMVLSLGDEDGRSVMRKPRLPMDLTGHSVNQVKVVGPAPDAPDGELCWEYECLACGNHKAVRRSYIVGGRLHDCGCRRGPRKAATAAANRAAKVREG